TAAPEVRIDLRANFRSRRPVLDAGDHLFRHVMTQAVGEMDYGPDQERVYGAGAPAAAPPVDSPPVERTREPGAAAGRATDGRGGEGGADDVPDLADWSAFEREALVVARRLRQLLDNQTPVWDKHAKAYRPMRPRDIAILL